MKKPMVFIGGNETLTDSNFFQVLIDIASEMRIRIDFYYDGLEENHDTYWGEETFSRNFVQTWKSKHSKKRELNYMICLE